MGGKKCSKGRTRRNEWGTYSLLHLNRVDVHLCAWILERVVKYEDIVVVHVSSRWAFLEHFFLPARQALESASQYRILWMKDIVEERVMRSEDTLMRRV